MSIDKVAHHDTNHRRLRQDTPAHLIGHTECDQRHLLRVTVMEVMSHDDNKRNDEKDHVTTKGRVKEELNDNDNKGVRI